MPKKRLTDNQLLLVNAQNSVVCCVRDLLAANRYHLMRLTNSIVILKVKITVHHYMCQLILTLIMNVCSIFLRTSNTILVLL